MVSLKHLNVLMLGINYSWPLSNYILAFSLSQLELVYGTYNNVTQSSNYWHIIHIC